MAETVFEHRGFMLDVSRHYMPPGEIRKLLQAAAVLNMNRMHWHLTDDQGWRIEIRKYPQLTEKGAVRGDSFFGGTPAGERNSGFYTQEEIRETVAFAQGLGIEIIPEIEMPGHAAALLDACPEYGCRRGETGERWENRVEISGGIFPSLICAGNDGATAFLRDVLDEVTDLFPYQAVHIGGDEALKLRWRRCPDCRRRMRELGLQSEDALQRRLVLDMGEYLAKKGRKTIVWNDVLAGGPLPPHFIVQQWLGGEAETRAFMESGGTVIRSETEHFYMDYPYGSIDVRKIWKMPGIPDYAAGLEDRLLGMECPLWTERVASLDRAAYLLLPRMAALSLRMSGAELSWEDFRNETAALTRKAERETGLRGAPEDRWDLSPEEAAAELEAEHRKIFSPETCAFVGTEGKLTALEDAERLGRRIGLPEDFLLRGGDSVLAELYGKPVPENDDGAGTLARQLMTAAESRKYGAWKGIPEEIWLDTMKCFARFAAEHRRSFGRDGFDRAEWTTRQTGARLFRIGELEYEMAETPSGRREIGLHIPSDARLEAPRLNESLEAADRFFRDRYPGWADAPRTCESWLLSPALKELLLPGSRILRFQEAFDILETDPEDDAALEWVFYVAGAQRKGLDLHRLPEDTSLQRKMKALLLAGGKPGSARGVLKRAFSDENCDENGTTKNHPVH